MPHIGYRHTEETKAKLRMAWKNRAPISEETRERLRVSHRGQKHIRSEEWKLKQRAVQRGKPNKKNSGARSHLWRGGIAPLANQIRETCEYKTWRRSVFARDGYKCRECGKGGTLNADHIRPFSLILRENSIKTKDQAQRCVSLWDTSNGRTLCVGCHRRTATFGRGCLRFLQNPSLLSLAS